jgi:hypothetical protein
MSDWSALAARMALIDQITALRMAELDAANMPADIDTIKAATLATVAGKAQIKSTTINLNQASNTYVLFTGAVQGVEVEALAIRISDTTVVGTALTSISIQSDDTTPHIFIPVADGAVANLTAQATLSWENNGGIYYMPVGKTIGLTILDSAGADRVCTVVVKYRAVVSGGTLT